MAVTAPEAFFLPLDGGHRFCVLHRPQEGPPARGALLHVHAFAEEMNKSRRAVAQAARSFARDGWFVLQIDLFGCGDSSGEFADASWERWGYDVASAFAWLTARTGLRPALWGLRGGALLATHALREIGIQPHLLFWQPVIAGKMLLNQFLRLASAGDMLGEREARTSTKSLRDRLKEGDTVEVAGYKLGPALALPLDVAALDLPPRYTGHVLWCEVDALSPIATLAPASSERIDRWRAESVRVPAAVVRDLPFWQTQEIAECAELVEISRPLLSDLVS